MSIVRIGLAETKKFAEGYEAIFRKKKATAAEVSGKAVAKKAKGNKKKPKKK